jgi:alkaline phosphatase
MSWKLAGFSALTIFVACGDGGSSSSDAGMITPDASYPGSIQCSSELTPSGSPTLPKNIIIIMGDGMGPVQIEAAGIMNQHTPLRFEGISEPVYFNTDSITTDRATDPSLDPTDSAAAATAMATGVRTLNGALGLDPDGQSHQTVAELARAEGKSIGLVTTSFIYDASPMAWVVHHSDRDDYSAILDQLLTFQPEVILGGGRPIFEEGGGARLTQAENAGYHILSDQTELAAWDTSANPKALGLFQGTAVSLSPSLYEWFMTPVSYRKPESTDPPLDAMVSRALDALSSDQDGFFLFVENEHIDTLGHVALVEREIAPTGVPAEVLEVDKAVAVALDWIATNSSFDETLLVVTADHETGGYTLYGEDLSEAWFWGTPEHTRQPVAIYAAGPGSANMSSICRISDLHHLLTGQLPASR